MLKERRNRRASVGEALGITPDRRERDTGTNLREESAEQLALLVAKNQHRERNEGEGERTQSKNRRDSGISVATATWGLTRDGRRRRTTEHFENLFQTPQVNGDDATEESWISEEPNTEDRQFIKDSIEEASDPDYEPTDPAEWSMDTKNADEQWDPRLLQEHGDGRVNTENKTYVGELDTKTGFDFEETHLKDLGEILGLQKASPNPRAPVQRQLTPEFNRGSEDEALRPLYSRDLPRSNKSAKHTRIQEVNLRGEVDTLDPREQPGGFPDDLDGARGGDIDTVDPSERLDRLDRDDSNRQSQHERNYNHQRDIVDKHKRVAKHDTRVAGHAPSGGR